MKEIDLLSVYNKKIDQLNFSEQAKYNKIKEKIEVCDVYKNIDSFFYMIFSFIIFIVAACSTNLLSRIIEVISGISFLSLFFYVLCNSDKHRFIGLISYISYKLEEIKLKKQINFYQN